MQLFSINLYIFNESNPLPTYGINIIIILHFFLEDNYFELLQRTGLKRKEQHKGTVYHLSLNY